MEKLNLTPEEICNKEFSIDFKGYNADEVDAYIDQILDDYDKFENNIEELLFQISSLEDEIEEYKERIKELEASNRAFDLSNTTTYSSVDILKRLSRLEEMMLKK